MNICSLSGSSTHGQNFNMARKKIKLADPYDSEQVRDYIIQKARRSESATLKKFLSEIPTPNRLPVLSQGYNPQDFDLVSHAQIVAARVHIRGKIAETPCNNCQAGSGPFLHCVYLREFDDLTKMCCTNCQFNLYTDKRDRSKRGVQLCSFAKG
jgi:hypothetical protein